MELRDFLAFRYISGPAFSPDGKNVCFTVTEADADENTYRHCLHLLDMETGKVRQMTAKDTEGTFAWLDGDRILFPAGRENRKGDAKDDGFTAWYCLDIHGGEALPFFRLPLKVSELIPLSDRHFYALAAFDPACPDYASLPEEDRKAWREKALPEKDYEVLDHAPFWFNGSGFDHTRQGLFSITASPFSVRRISDVSENVSSAHLQKNRLLFVSTPASAKPRLRGFSLKALDFETGSVSALYTNEDLMLDTLLSDPEDEEHVWFLAAGGQRYGINENPWLYRLNLPDGSLMVLSENACSVRNEVCTDCAWSEDSQPRLAGGEVLITSTVEGSAHLYGFSLKDGSRRSIVTRPGSLYCLAVSNTGKAVAAGMYDMGLEELCEIDLRSGELTCRTHLNTALDGLRVSLPVPLTAERDGVTIQGWVFPPSDAADGKKHPAVLDVHGGPKCAYGPVYFHEMQVWASLGFYVFFCNPRGSDGRDNAFADIRGRYGTVDYEDIMAFTDRVLDAYPEIDRSRVCVTGGSYGGFMTNWIISHTDRFCCAASQRSISNWLSFTGVSDIGLYFAPDQTGADLKDPSAMWKQSPLAYAENVHTPTLFIHADEDYRCPLEQGLQMFSALLAHDIEARFCLFHGENHELSRSGKPLHRIRRLQEITDWFLSHTREEN